MSYIRLHRKTGVYWFRRPVPGWLKGHVPHVDGFPDNPNRAEWTKTLGTKVPSLANRYGAELNARVDDAIEAARADVQAAPAPVRIVSTATLTPAMAFAVLERWEVAEREDAEHRLFNGKSEPAWIEIAGQGDPDRDYHLAQFGRHARSEPDLWQRMPDFDQALVTALERQGIAVSADHPALPRLRSAFALVWSNVLTAIGHMRAGVWDWRPEPVATAPVAVAVPDGLPLDAKVNDWRATLGMHERQCNMYVSDVRQWAAGLPKVTTATITKEDVQSWATGVLKSGEIGMKTLNRKLSAIRLYWRYMKAHGHTKVDGSIFKELYLRDVRTEAKQSTEKQRYRPEEVVSLWKAARAHKRGEVLSDLIKLAAFTGARIESLCSLKADQVTVDPDTKVRVIRFGDKTDAGRREVPIPDAFGGFVDRLIKAADKDSYLIKVWGENKYGERSALVGKAYGKLKTELKFGREHDFHSFRRTVAHLLENNLVPENFAADILGHEKDTISYGLYSGLTRIDLRKQFMDKAIVYPDQEFMTV